MTKQEIQSADDAANWLRDRAAHYEATEPYAVNVIQGLYEAADDLEGAEDDE